MPIHVRAPVGAAQRLLVGACCMTVLAVLGGCGDVPLAPSSVAGTYSLVEVDGEPMPAVLSTDVSDALLLVADTLKLDIAGGLTGRRCQRRIDYVRNSSTDSCWDYAGSYRVQVQAIDIAIGCQLGQVCTVVSLRTAKLDGDMLTVSRDQPGGRLTYHRVSP